MSGMMSSRAEDLFSEIMELPSAARGTYLDQHCSDPSLRAEVERLMAAAGRSAHFLESLGQRLGVTTLLDPEHELPPSRTIGAYRLIRLLGRGGMGAVYLADRADGQYEKQVAIKLLPFGAGDELSRRRFFSERQILARLVHPNIARLLDGGIAEHDTPYFVMDYVNGMPIDRFFEERSLSLRARIEAFLAVADAVAYAHRNLVVHRDIKPGNVLVDEAGQVKLVDFGVAKLVAREAEGSTLPGTRPLTVRYASPEALRGEPDTTATDVYSLGVLLYTLLTGQHPYPGGGDEVHALQRHILDSQPLPASRAVTDAPTDTTRRMAAAQRLGLPALAKLLKGDLDTILGTALNKDPARRYSSVEQLRGDLRRHLASEPISVRPPSLAYLTSRLVRRRRGLVAGLGTIAVLLAALAVLGVDYTLTTQRQAELIANERDVTGEIRDFLVEIFSSSRPERAEGNPVTARELLDRGAERILQEFPQRPALQAPLLTAIAQAYDGLTLYEQARTQYENSLNVYRQIGEAESRAYARNLFELAYIHERMGNYGQAQHLTDEGIVLAGSLNLGGLLADNLELSARLLQRQDQLDGVDALYRRALALRRQAFGSESHEAAETLSNLATVLQQQDDLPGAEALHLEALDIRRRLDGEARPEHIEQLYNLGVVTRQQGRLQEARDYYHQALEVIGAFYPEGYSDDYYILNGLGLVYRDLGDPATALEYLEESGRKIEESFGPGHPNLAFSYANQGELLLQLEHFEEAVAILQKSVAIFVTAMPEHRNVHRVKVQLGNGLMALSDWQPAESTLLEAYAGATEAWGAAHEVTRSALESLVALYERWDKPDEVAGYRGRLAALP